MSLRVVFYRFVHNTAFFLWFPLFFWCCTHFWALFCTGVGVLVWCTAGFASKRNIPGAKKNDEFFREPKNRDTEKIERWGSLAVRAHARTHKHVYIVAGTIADFDQFGLRAVGEPYSADNLLSERLDIRRGCCSFCSICTPNNSSSVPGTGIFLLDQFCGAPERSV